MKKRSIYKNLTCTLLSMLFISTPVVNKPLADHSKSGTPIDMTHVSPSGTKASGPRVVQLALNPNEIQLSTGAVDVKTVKAVNLSEELSSSVDIGYYLVHFLDRPNQEVGSRFTQTIPIENTLYYFPSNAYLCRLSADQLDILQDFKEVDWIGAWLPEYKISPEVEQNSIDYRDPVQPQEEFIITLFPGEDLPAAIHPITEMGGTIRAYTQDRIHIQIAKDKLPQVAALEGVYWIERHYPTTPSNDNATWIMQTNSLGNRKVFDSGLTGQGQRIGISDTGVDADHLMFWDSINGLPDHTFNAARRKILTYYNWFQTGILTGTVPGQYYDPGDGYYPLSTDPIYNLYDWDLDSPLGTNPRAGHGTHTAGTTAGEWVTGIVLPTLGIPTTSGYDYYEGNAFGAKIIYQDLGRPDLPYLYPPPDLNDPTASGTLNGVPYPGSVGLFPQALSDGAYIHLDPWNSAGGFATYTSYSRDVDEMAWANKDFLSIYPVGDSGPGSGTIQPPATAKNCLSVGAAETSNDSFGHDSENVASFSSWGPTGGWGRIKPDVCAPGQVINSAMNDNLTDGTSPNDGLVNQQGTSMAAASVAGASALVRQYYMGGNYNPVGASTGFQGSGAFTPSASLMKSTIINSAEPMKGANRGGAIPGDGQGWGRVLLDNSLFFSGEVRSLLVDDNRSGLDGAAIVQPFFKVYTVSVGPGQPLVVDVSYTDPPGAAGSAFQMVNYLYVEVDHPNSVTYYLSGSGNFSNGSSVPNTSFIYPDTLQKIRINNPDPGIYTIFVVAFQTEQVNPGWNVQPYALAVSGNLVQSQGYVQFDKQYYMPGDNLVLTLTDTDLSGTGSANVNVSSGTTGDTESVSLSEIYGATGIFGGTLPTSLTPGIPSDGNLQVANLDTITVTYNDANPVGVRSDTAQVDGIPPVASNLSVSTDYFIFDSTTTITATISDVATGGNNIDEAELFVDVTGADGSGTPMMPVDGSLDSPEEVMVATGVVLNPGDHTLYVHGKDVAGNWGSTESILWNILYRILFVIVFKN